MSLVGIQVEFADALLFDGQTRQALFCNYTTAAFGAYSCQVIGTPLPAAQRPLQMLGLRAMINITDSSVLFSGTAVATLNAALQNWFTLPGESSVTHIVPLAPGDEPTQIGLISLFLILGYALSVATYGHWELLRQVRRRCRAPC